jgi:hypothetical protein
MLDSSSSSLEARLDLTQSRTAMAKCVYRLKIRKYIIRNTRNINSRTHKLNILETQQPTTTTTSAPRKLSSIYHLCAFIKM